MNESVAPAQKLDYSEPYNMMVGSWTGVSMTYGADGVYQGTEASRVLIHWDSPSRTLLHFRQTRLGTNHKVPGFVVADYELHIDGKLASGSSTDRSSTCHGIQTLPNVYLFEIVFQGNGDQPYQKWFNNQYFTTDNERLIIGPVVDEKGNTVSVVAQTFTRISYDVGPAPRTASLI